MSTTTQTPEAIHSTSSLAEKPQAYITQKKKNDNSISNFSSHPLGEVPLLLPRQENIITL